MNAQLAVLAGTGVYLLLGVLVIWIRWRYGILRAMMESMGSEYGVPPDKIKIALPLYVMIWPFFVRGIFSDMGRISKIRKIWNDRTSRCECGGTLSVDNARIRGSMRTGDIVARCASCSRETTSKLDIRTELDT